MKTTRLTRCKKNKKSGKSIERWIEGESGKESDQMIQGDKKKVHTTGKMEGNLVFRVQRCENVIKKEKRKKEGTKERKTNIEQEIKRIRSKRKQF